MTTSDNWESQSHRCPGCGRFTSGHAGLSEGSAETWYWRCVCGKSGSEGF
jgi:hypothetical protein